MPSSNIGEVRGGNYGEASRFRPEDEDTDQPSSDFGLGLTSHSPHDVSQQHGGFHQGTFRADPNEDRSVVLHDPYARNFHQRADAGSSRSAQHASARPPEVFSRPFDELSGPQMAVRFGVVSANVATTAPAWSSARSATYPGMTGYRREAPLPHALSTRAHAAPSEPPPSSFGGAVDWPHSSLGTGPTEIKLESFEADVTSQPSQLGRPETGGAGKFIKGGFDPGRGYPIISDFQIDEMIRMHRKGYTPHSIAATVLEAPNRDDVVFTILLAKGYKPH